MGPDQQDYYFLRGGGELGALIRATDWSKTSIGSPDTWPHSLRTMVAMMLSSKFPMFLWWGDDLVQFYNDAYRQSLGDNGKHPKALGQKGEDCWTEVWPVISPLIEKARTAGEATWNEDQLIPIYRNGVIEDVYWTFGYSPVFGDTGNIDGVLAVCTETTGKVKNKVALEESKDALEFAIEAAELATWDIDIISGIINGNGRLHKFFGIPDEVQVTYDAIIATVPVSERWRIEEAYANALQPASGGRFKFEYPSIHPVTNKEHIYSPKGKMLFNEDGVAVRFNGIIQDVTEQVQARKVIEQSEQHFRKLITESTIATALLSGPGFVVDIANNAMLKLWGKDLSIIGKTLEEIMPEQLNQRYLQLLGNVFHDGIEVHEEGALVLINRGGRMDAMYRDFSYKPLRDQNGEVASILVTVVDVTEKVIAQKRLLRSEERFQGAVAALKGILWTSNAEGKMEGAQPGWASLTGQSFDEYQGYGWANAIHPDDAAATLAAWNDAVHGQKTFIFEHRVKMGNGQWGQFAIRAVPLFHEDGSVREWVGVHTDITEQRKAEYALKESEQRYRLLMEEGTVATALYIGPEIRIQYVNDTMLGYWGKDRSVIGKTFREALPELEGQAFPGLLDAVFASGNTHFGKEELAYIEINGKLQASYYNYTYKALFSEDGAIYGIHHTAIDVTELVLARKMAEESEQKLRSVVDNAPFPIAVYVGKEMRVELANRSIMDIWGKGYDVIGKNFTDVLPELGSQEVFDQIIGVFNSGVSYHTRSQRLDLIVNGKNRPYWFNYSFTPLLDSSGKVYGVMNTGVDNTDIVLAKLKVEENEKNIRNTILKAPVAMCILRGPQHIVEIANDRMIEFWGTTAERIMDKPIFVGLPEAKDQGFEELLHKVYTTGETVAAQGVPVNLPRGEEIAPLYVNLLYEAFREADGSISGIICVVVDVTDQVHARLKIEEVVARRTGELAQANTNLQRSNNELAQFAYIASHDLQEPVRKVSTFAQMLEQSLGDVNEKSKRYLTKINEASARMTTLIRDVLSYSQLAKEKEDFVAVDLQQVLESILVDFELLVEQKQAVITSHGLPVIEAIPLQMTQLFGNLISNSLKYSREGVPVVLSITATPLSAEDIEKHDLNTNAGPFINIEFRDNGIGFKQEYAEQIFNIFQRLHGKSDFSGTGIGLAMCKRIIQNHHGEIYAIGKENEAIFNVILPLKQN